MTSADAASSSERGKVKEKRKAKKAEKESLMAKVPTHDEDGIAYTKLQIRRMTKRVKRGLPAVPSEAEEAQRKREIKLEKKRDEEELSGMIYDRQTKDSKEENKSNDSEEEAADEEPKTKTDSVTTADADKSKDESEDDDADDEDVEERKGEAADETDNSGERTKTSSETQKDDVVASDAHAGEAGVVCTPAASATATTNNNEKSRCSSKPVPSDYVCYACDNEVTPAHWIYDCPKKINRPGSNQKKKRKVSENEDGTETDGGGGINDHARRVFVSGLPFEVTTEEVRDFFEKECDGGVTSCKLLTFSDSNRCKGAAFLIFETERSAQRALDMSGSDRNVKPAAKPRPTKETTAEDKPAKVLKLKVAKFVNRPKPKKRKQ